LGKLSNETQEFAVVLREFVVWNRMWLNVYDIKREEKPVLISSVKKSWFITRERKLVSKASDNVRRTQSAWEATIVLLCFVTVMERTIFS